MRRIQINTTLSEESLDFIRENLGKMNKTEMAKKLRCSEGKLRENARIAGIEFPSKNRHGFSVKKGERQSKFFTGREYARWIC